MDSTVHPSNPFDMLINPQAILDAVENSNCLRNLKSKICRPLDQAPKPAAEGAASTESADDDLAGAGSRWFT
jgi:hypothetical protein